MASFLVDGFRQTRELFPSDLRKKFVGVVISRARKHKRKNQPEATVEQQAADMATRLQQQEPSPEPEEPMDADAPLEQDSFRGVAFDDWVTLILQVRRSGCSVADVSSTRSFSLSTASTTRPSAPSSTSSSAASCGPSRIGCRPCASPWQVRRATLRLISRL